MADTKPPAPAPGAAAAAPAATAPPAATYKAPGPNPLRMMGIPIPRKLPSRNWMIFWAITGAFSAAIIYDKREKKRATAKWGRVVSHLAKEPISNPAQLPRKLTIFLEAPPGDGLRVAQDHFTEYVKPVLAASGLDWEFVQGRQQGDVRAAVAERIRRQRQPAEKPETDDEIIADLRKKNHTPEFQGMRGDIVIGRNTWKEYIRGLHEGWLGPLTAPPIPEPEITPQAAESTEAGEGAEKKEEEKKQEEEKPKRPPQIPPYNTTNDYPSSHLPLMIPGEFSPSTPIPFPHVLGFSSTPRRLGWFLNRRKLADDIGREVAAVCIAAAREYKDEDPETGLTEQQSALQEQEKLWVKAVWKEEPEKDAEGNPRPPKELVWASPMVLDPRVSMRMRRFQMLPEDEARAKEVVVPEEEVEGFIKGSLRSLWRWGASAVKKEEKPSWYDKGEPSPYPTSD